jgi:hypothetical protein
MVPSLSRLERVCLRSSGSFPSYAISRIIGMSLRHSRNAPYLPFVHTSGHNPFKFHWWLIPRKTLLRVSTCPPLVGATLLTIFTLAQLKCQVGQVSGYPRSISPLLDRLNIPLLHPSSSPNTPCYLNPCPCHSIPNILQPTTYKNPS